MKLSAVTRSILLVTLVSGLAGLSETTTKETKQLTVSMSASADSVKPGQRVALTLDIDLKPKMHVYAPGVERYIAIDWQMANGNAAKAQPATWPKAEKLRLDAIDETVPAYTGRFRVVRNIVMGPQARGAVTIHGTLKYQACDDRMCYVPASVPLEWTFSAAQK